MKIGSHVKVLTITACLVMSAVASEDHATYAGGTPANGIAVGRQGTFNLHEDSGVFFSTAKAETLRIPYARITDVEYGEKTSDRFSSPASRGAAAVGSAVVPGFGPMSSLFAKKKRQCLTFHYKDDRDSEQVASFELNQELAKKSIQIVEYRTGLRVQNTQPVR